MPDYICYFVGGTNSTVATEHATHPADQTAIEWAEGRLITRADCVGVELWRETRCIYRNRREDA